MLHKKGEQAVYRAVKRAQLKKRVKSRDPTSQYQRAYAQVTAMNDSVPEALPHKLGCFPTGKGVSCSLKPSTDGYFDMPGLDKKRSVNMTSAPSSSLPQSSGRLGMCCHRSTRRSIPRKAGSLFVANW